MNFYHRNALTQIYNHSESKTQICSFCSVPWIMHWEIMTSFGKTKVKSLIFKINK